MIILWSDICLLELGKQSFWSTPLSQRSLRNGRHTLSSLGIRMTWTWFSRFGFSWNISSVEGRPNWPIIMFLIKNFCRRTKTESSSHYGVLRGLHKSRDSPLENFRISKFENKKVLTENLAGQARWWRSPMNGRREWPPFTELVIPAAQTVKCPAIAGSYVKTSKCMTSIKPNQNPVNGIWNLSCWPVRLVSNVGRSQTCRALLDDQHSVCYEQTRSTVNSARNDKTLACSTSFARFKCH